MANTLKVTLVKSPIGAVPKHKKTVAAMGLTKMHKTVEMPDNAATDFPRSLATSSGVFNCLKPSIEIGRAHV